MSDRDVVNRLALEDRDEAYMVENVAPLVGKLEEGKNFVNAQQFADLVRWFEDELGDPDETMEVGRFQLYNLVEVVRVKPVTRMTVADMVRKTGLSYNTIKRLIAKTALVPQVEGAKKYYYIADLSPFLSVIANRREE